MLVGATISLKISLSGFVVDRRPAGDISSIQGDRSSSSSFLILIVIRLMAIDTDK